MVDKMVMMIVLCLELSLMQECL